MGQLHNRVPTLPIEVWRLVAQELAGGDYPLSDLVAFSRVCWAFARVGLPEAYAAYMRHTLDVFYVGEPDEDIFPGFRFWRSIVSSCLGSALFPYFLWITRLDLCNLHQSIPDPLRPEHLIDLFGSHPLESLGIWQDGSNGLDVNVVGTKIVNLICEAIWKARDEGRSSRIEDFCVVADFLSPSYLAKLVAALPNLTEIQCLDAAFLNGDIGRVVWASCPSFKLLHVSDPHLTSNDSQLQDFVQNLGPDTLEGFVLVDTFPTGPELAILINILRRQSRSLKTLDLKLLPENTQTDSISLLPSFGMLRYFRDLESVSLDLDRTWIHANEATDWQGEPPDVQPIAKWLSSCSRLKNLTLRYFPFLQPIFAQAFGSSPIRLTSLKLTLLIQFISDEMWEALSKQTELEKLEIRWLTLADVPNTVHQSRRERLVQLVTSCRKLQALTLDEDLHYDDLQLIMSLPDLQDINLVVHHLDDRCVASLANLISGRSIKLYGITSTATAEATRRLLEVIFERHGGEYYGDLCIWFRTTHQHQGFTKREFIELRQLMKDQFYGLGLFNLTPEPLS